MYLHNSLSKTKEELKPLEAGKVKIYVCGPTVYNFLHVGNFRGPVVFNLLRNWLEEKGYQVTYAMNFTDVDDKIIEAAKTEGMAPQELAEKYIQEYKKDFSSLGLRAHHINPKVTESMDAIYQVIENLVSQNRAYEKDGDVYYSVRSFAEYGKLSGRKIDELQSGARVEVDTTKKDPLDFALWKAAKPGEPFWQSPWGNGRPGWHIECSAMVCKHFGDTIDIHGGGSDLLFPHHENEIAQSEGATQQPLAKLWMHWQMLNFGGQKMSKSLGNFTTLRNFLEKNHPEIYKWMILSTHYRSTCDFTDEAIDRAVGGLSRVYSALALAHTFTSEPSQTALPNDAAFEEEASKQWTKVESSLNDDLNTPEVFAAIFEMVRAFNQKVNRGSKKSPALAAKAKILTEFIQKAGKLMAIFQEPAAEFLVHLDDLLLKKMQLDRRAIDDLVSERSTARVSRDFKKSDELRAKLTQMGISVSDTAEGSFWEVAK